MNVLFVHFGDDWLSGSEIALLQLMNGIKRNGVAPFLWCNAPAMDEAARKLGMPVFRSAFAFYFDYDSPRFSLGRYARSVREGRRFISETGADLVHCNSAAPLQWMLPAARKSRVPILAQVHSCYLRRSRYVLGLHLADAVVAVSTAAAAPLIADGMPLDRVAVVFNGFDVERLLAGDRRGLRSELGIPKEAVVGAIVGALIHRKGHDILFEAMRRAGSFERPFCLLVIGDGPERARLEQMAAGLPVYFLGHCADVGAILRDAADILVIPSRAEAFGRVVIEAAFCGLPAMGSDVEGIPEAIQEGVTGLLFPAGSPATLAEALKLLVNDESLRERLGAAAMKRARQEFTIETCAAKMAAIYETAVARHRKEAPAASSPWARLKPYANLLYRRGARPTTAERR